MYLDTETVKSAYNHLSEMGIQHDSVLHIFFILKGCGFNTIDKLSTSLISDLGMKPAFCMGSLFSPEEELPDNYDFISPFHMHKWRNQAPSESLQTWVGGRIKNNVIGGATTWRKILLQESSDNEELIKFGHNYISEIKSITLGESKINFFAFAIWSLRFTYLEKEYSFTELGRILKIIFKLTEKEESELFYRDIKDLKLCFANEMHNTQNIRDLIGKPPKINDINYAQWLEREIIDYDPQIYINMEINQEIDMELSKVTSEEKVFQLLNRNYQVILSGPPGTSKSFIAKSIGRTYFDNNITKIQFHPKYSYQDFIGGYIVDGINVKFEKGVLLDLVDDAKQSPDTEFLLIIDELNRANVGQVFGETIQCLDRDHDVQVRVDANLQDLNIPKNLKIIATMNTADRSLGIFDFAIRRRFVTVYCPPDYDVLYEKCNLEGFNFSAGDFLRKINQKIVDVLKNKELAIGHAIFLDSFVQDNEKNYIWNKENFEDLFNYKILPTIEEYTKGQNSDIRQILGDSLPSQLFSQSFVDAVESFIANED